MDFSQNAMCVRDYPLSRLQKFSFHFYFQISFIYPDANQSSKILPDGDTVHNTPFTQFQDDLTRLKNLSKHSDVWKDSLCRDLSYEIFHEPCLTAKTGIKVIWMLIDLCHQCLGLVGCFSCFLRGFESLR